MTDTFKDWESGQPQMMTRRSTAEMFGENLEDSLMRCKPEDLEYNNGQLIYYFLLGDKIIFLTEVERRTDYLSQSINLVFYNHISSNHA